MKDAITQGKRLPNRTIFHAPPGQGKTSFAAMFPKPIFVLSPRETGIQTLIDNNQVPPSSSIEVEHWTQLFDLIRELTATDHDYKTLAIDTLNGMEKLAIQHIIDVDYGGVFDHKGFLNYQAGYDTLANREWVELLNALDKLREVKSMEIMCLCHSGIDKAPNAMDSDYLKYRPELHKKVWPITSGWADLVLFGYSPINIEKQKDPNKPAKASGGMRRIINATINPIFDAKNRHGLDNDIEMGSSAREAYDNYQQALIEGKEKNNV